MKRRELTFIIVALLLGAVVGGLVGDIIGTFLPPGAAKTLFTKSIEIGCDTFKVDFYAISFTFGLTLKINFMSMLVLLLVIVYFRWWYL
ncbi:MAG: DUF4321 domain-containing protein [candidate division Zixibacteria bacterium]|nr:DUF4321 domain-containing protein [candidate division Zixibacteria bacterium]MDH3937702.1 DUF4321 domain-containing protein [candidate division Zixibacteria bacterium]MDH4034468.1 DUF4321 domain-containing protein [candidate division Zixibacteria bacterium]